MTAAAQLLDLLLQTTVALERDMSSALAADGLTTSRATLLWVLRDRGPSTQQALAGALGVSARNVTGLVDALEASGFVERRAHPSDRRAILVTFTTKGERTVERLRAERLEFSAALFAGVPDPEALGAGLTAVRDRLFGMLAEAAR